MASLQPFLILSIVKNACAWYEIFEHILFNTIINSIEISYCLLRSGMEDKVLYHLWIVVVYLNFLRRDTASIDEISGRQFSFFFFYLTLFGGVCSSYHFLEVAHMRKRRERRADISRYLLWCYCCLKSSFKSLYWNWVLKVIWENKAQMNIWLLYQNPNSLTE